MKQKKTKKEYLDIVNDDDEVIGKALYQDVYKNLSPHRIVHILIFNTKGDMLLQLRSHDRHFAPSHWSTSVGGHVRSGETYKEAALREAEEELGVIPEIEEAFKDTYIDEHGHKKFLTTFKAIDKGYRFSIDPHEVQRVEFVSLPDIHNMITKGEKFHPELLFLLKKHFDEH